MKSKNGYVSWRGIHEIRFSLVNKRMKRWISPGPDRRKVVLVEAKNKIASGLIEDKVDLDGCSKKRGGDGLQRRCDLRLKESGRGEREMKTPCSFGISGLQQ
ncbi:unnamed protein product [Cochlearia groenlandica]